MKWSPHCKFEKEARTQTRKLCQYHCGFTIHDGRSKYNQEVQIQDSFSKTAHAQASYGLMFLVYKQNLC